MIKKIISLFVCLAVISVTVPGVFAAEFTLSEVPDYSGNAYVSVNGGKPYFTEEDYTAESFETYSELDSLGRCTLAYACIGIDLMPTEERGNIGSVKPSGWQSVKYDIVDGKYLYNRCHLIGWQLTAENANKRNLITGTRYLNIEGMLVFENMTADYIKEENAEGYDSHVLYRVTPVFEDDNLVATGVLMEAYSIEDEGEGICFCVFCYNVQPGIVINYKDGTSSLAEETDNYGKTYTVTLPICFVINTSSKKFHLDTCGSASSMAEENRDEYEGDAQTLIDSGYSACKSCHPEKAVPQTVTYYYGDVDLDGKIASSDARLVLRVAVELEELNELGKTLSDVDFNGKITSADARRVLRVAVGLEVIE